MDVWVNGSVDEWDDGWVISLQQNMLKKDSS
jgi:hypothetical protein